MMKAKGENDKDGVDDEVNAIFATIVEEDDTLEKTESLSPPWYPASMEFWGENARKKAMMKAKGENDKDGVDDEVNAIFATIVEEDDTLEMAESLSPPWYPASMEFWGENARKKAMMKAKGENDKDGVDDEMNVITTA